MKRFLERGWILCAPSQYCRQYRIPLANNFKAGLKGERVTFTLFLQHVQLQLLESQARDYSQHCSDDGKDFRGPVGSLDSLPIGTCAGKKRASL